MTKKTKKKVEDEEGEDKEGEERAAKNLYSPSVTDMRNNAHMKLQSNSSETTTRH